MFFFNYLILLLKGTNMEKANEIIKNSGLNIVSELDFDKAANKACQLAIKS